MARIVRFGVFELDLRSGELRKSGARLNLPDQPLQILTALLEQPGALVTRDEFRQRLWADDTFVDFEHGLNAAVKRLRDVLGDSTDTHRFVETVPKRGYRFVASVQATNAASTDVASVESAAAGAPGFVGGRDSSPVGGISLGPAGCPLRPWRLVVARCRRSGRHIVALGGVITSACHSANNSRRTCRQRRQFFARRQRGDVHAVERKENRRLEHLCIIRRFRNGSSADGRPHQRP